MVRIRSKSGSGASWSKLYFIPLAIAILLLYSLLMLNMLSDGETTQVTRSSSTRIKLPQVIKHLINHSPETAIVQDVAKEGSAVSGKEFKATIKRESLLAEGFQLKLKVSSDRCVVPIIAVTTTLANSSACVDGVASMMHVVVVGDQGSSDTFQSDHSENVTFLSIAKQQELYPNFHAVLPTKNFARKNMGYLHAIEMGACFVYDFDDDNYLTNRTIQMINYIIANSTIPPAEIAITSDSAVVNPYLLYGSPNFIWPRGYPLQDLAKREFPRMLMNSKETEIGVLQIMQDLDPDVDANWRLDYGDSLPMKWKMSLPLRNARVAIHPTKWSPFNAQSTIITRDVALTALLPHTVHGRVADIWRSYIMQYLMKKMASPKLLAFGGQLVEHKRNKHSFMADRQAEYQLAEQTQQLVAYLDSRPVTHDNLLYQEMVLLYDDLYQRGFLEAQDVETAMVWLESFSMLPEIAMMNSEYVEVQKPEPSPVIAVVHLNYGHNEVIPLWTAIHGHQFQDVFFYMPTGITPCLPISGIRIHCISNDYRGMYAYESTINAIGLINSDKQYLNVQGLVFVHDDVAWHADAKFGDGISFRSNHVIPFNLSDSNGWAWSQKPMGAPAAQHFLKTYNLSTDFYFGQSDEYFLTRSEFNKFQDVGMKMLKSNLFLEIAVPTIFQSFLRRRRYVELLAQWGPTRHMVRVNGYSFCRDESKFFFAHPFKLTTIDNVLAHMKC